MVSPGEMVLADPWDAITEEFPEQEETPDRLDIQDNEHETFAHSRAQVSIGRQEYCDQLNAHADGSGKPLVILGESGCTRGTRENCWASMVSPTKHTMRRKSLGKLFPRACSGEGILILVLDGLHQLEDKDNASGLSGSHLLWNRDGDLLANLEGHENNAEGVISLPDGQILSWSDDNFVCLWNSEGGLLFTYGDKGTEHFRKFAL